MFFISAAINVHWQGASDRTRLAVVDSLLLAPGGVLQADDDAAALGSWLLVPLARMSASSSSDLRWCSKPVLLPLSWRMDSALSWVVLCPNLRPLPRSGRLQLLWVGFSCGCFASRHGASFFSNFDGS